MKPSEVIPNILDVLVGDVPEELFDYILLTKVPIDTLAAAFMNPKLRDRFLDDYVVMDAEVQYLRDALATKGIGMRLRDYDAAFNVKLHGEKYKGGWGIAGFYKLKEKGKNK